MKLFAKPIENHKDEKIQSPSEDGSKQLTDQAQTKSARPSAFEGLDRKLKLQGFLNNPTAIQLLLEEIHSCKDRIRDLISYEEKFHEKNNQVAVLTERIKALNESINYRLLYITLGSLLFGVSPVLWGKFEFFIPDIILSLILIFVGYFKKSK